MPANGPLEKGPPLTQSRPTATPRRKLGLIQCGRGDLIPVTLRIFNRNTRRAKGLRETKFYQRAC